MKLKIDGVECTLSYFQMSPNGYILQLLMEGTDDSLRFRLFLEFLQTRFRGVMASSPYDNGFTEVRILSATMLQVIDAFRSEGYGVIELDPFSR